MDTLVYYLPAAACIGGMVLCIAMMGRGHSKGEASDTERAPARATDEEVARLREEVDALRAELQQRAGTREPA